VQYTIGTCNRDRDDSQAVRFFSNQRDSVIQSPDGSGSRTLGGVPQQGAGIFWTTTMALGSRVEIIGRYQRVRPDGFSRLARWLQQREQGAGYKSITIPCYKSTDPVVNLFGDRTTKGQVVFSVFWNDEREDWVFAGVVDPQDREQIEQLKAVIERLSCETLRFE